jgi:hypothetical protein
LIELKSRVCERLFCFLKQVAERTQAYPWPFTLRSDIVACNWFVIISQKLDGVIMSCGLKLHDAAPTYRYITIERCVLSPKETEKIWTTVVGL